MGNRTRLLGTPGSTLVARSRVARGEGREGGTREGAAGRGETEGLSQGGRVGGGERSSRRGRLSPSDPEVTEYECRARGSELRGRLVRRRRGWPRGRNGNGVVEDVESGERFVVNLRALRKR